MDFLRILDLILFVLVHFYFFCSYNEEEVMKLMSNNVRPRARYIMQWDQVSIGAWGPWERQYIAICYAQSLDWDNLLSVLCKP